MGCVSPALRLWAAATMLFAAQAAAAQSTGVVTGHVIAARDGEPLALVKVDLVGTTLSAITDDYGTFTLEGVPRGSYELRTTFVGYRSIRESFTLADGETKSFEIALLPTTLTATDSTTVTAAPFTPATETADGFNLDSLESKNLASVLADDPLRAVQSVPGVTANDDFSSEFTIRGAPFDRVGVYVDGILLHSPFHTTNGQASDGSVAMFSGDLVDDMTLYQGAWPSRYGDRTAGVLAVDTRPGSRDEIKGQVSSSASNTGVTAEGPLGHAQKGAWIAGVRKSYLQYLLDRVDFGDQPPFVFGFTDAQARLDYDVTPRHSISATFLGGTSGVDRTRYRQSLGPSTVMTSQFQSALVTVGSRFTTSHFLLNSRVAFSSEDGDVANRDNAALLDTHAREFSARSDGQYAWAHGSTEIGAEMRRASTDQLSSQIVFTPAAERVDDTVAGTAMQGGAYAQHTLSLTQWRLTSGIRIDAHSLASQNVVSPYATISFTPNAKSRIEIDWSRVGQFAELPQFLSRFAGSLAPERASDVELLVERDVTARARVRVELYDRLDRAILARPLLEPHRDAAGAIVPGQVDARLVNSQHGSSKGAQVLVQRRSANGLTGWVSYTYGRATLIDDVLHVQFSSDYDQRHTVNAYLSRRLKPTVNVSGRLSYGSGMPLPGFYSAFPGGGYQLGLARNDERAPAYARADLRVNKEIVRTRFSATLFGEVVNVTNHTNRDFDSAATYDPISGRSDPNFYTMLPILPSVGLVVAFGHGP